MKNSKYFPFERNKYFYGKLLSVDDFDLEQKYVNDKRRMTNRFLFGTGIVAGMYVVQVDEKTVSVEMGYALDSFGREIVIDAPVVKRISLIEGFDSCIQNHKDNYLYLCVDYGETQEDQVYNIVGNSPKALEEKQFNKIKESYKLYLTSNEPKKESLSVEALYEDIKTVYVDNGVRIRHVFSKYGVTKGKVEMRVEIENTGNEYLAFSYDVILSCMSFDKQPILKVSFDEMLYEKTGKYTLEYEIDILDVVDIDATAIVDEKTARFSLDKKAIEYDINGKNVVGIVKNDVKSAVIANYRKMAMENIVKNNSQDSIYLAKIYLINAGEFYIIDHIENVPFKQYVMNSELGYAFSKMMSKEAVQFPYDTVHKASGGGKIVGGKESNLNITRGKYKLNLGVGAQKNQKFFSTEIIHNLGLGEVTIILGIDGQDEKSIFGNSDIFAKSGVQVELAAQVDKAKGSFIIGAKVLNTAVEDGITVSWTAIQNVEDTLSERMEKKIFIKPNILEIGVRESYCFEVVCQNMVDKAVIWKVRNNGGSIDNNGLFTAPNTPGVYEVIAESIAYPDIKASIFVVVRDMDK